MNDDVVEVHGFTPLTLLSSLLLFRNENLGMRYVNGLVSVLWVVTKSGTKRNGMERFRLLKYGTHGTEQSRNSHGTVRFGSLASTALIMASSLSITRAYFALRMANVWYTRRR